MVWSSILKISTPDSSAGRRHVFAICLYIGANVGLSVVAASFAYPYASGQIAMIKLLVMFAVFAAAAPADVLTHKIPNLLVLTVFLVRVVLFVPEIIAQPSQWQQLVAGSAIRALAVFSLLMMLAVLSRGGFGMGDVKLMTAQTFLCGAYSASYTFFFALVSCAAVMIILILSSQKKRKDVIPLGPFFYIGYVLSLFLGCFHT